MVLKEEDLEYFNDEEEGEQEGAGKVDRRFDLMRGINELLLQRKTKAIEERKKQKSGDESLSDTTSSDSEESVREFICLKAKERKRSKIKELINRKKNTQTHKPRKIAKEMSVAPGIGQQVGSSNVRAMSGELRTSEPETKRKAVSEQPVDKTSEPTKKRSNHHVHKVPTPSTYYLKRQQTDFLARLTKAARDEHYGSGGGGAHDDANTTGREAVAPTFPNLDLVPVIIDSKQAPSSIYIRNRTKSQQPV